MTRVHTVARAGRRQRSASVRTNHRKPTFKIVKEVVTQEKKKFRTVASYNAEPPSGYSFIPVGYPDLTELCKKKCQDQNLQFQTVNATPKNKANLDPDKVSHHIHRVGNHFPTDIVHRACLQLGYWINSAKPGEYKKYNVGLENQLSRHQHKDEKDKIRAAIQELFPHLPAKDLKEILRHAFRKGSMRVGNADMPLIRRVQLAVSAHARHNYTDYDQLLKKISWGEARQEAEQPTLNQLKKWRGEDFDNHETEQVLRETIILDSESDDDSHTDSSDESQDHYSPNADRDVSLEFISHNTFGDDRNADSYNGHHIRDAYIAPSRRQAEYQALNALHRRDASAHHRPHQPLYVSLQPPPLVPIDVYRAARTGAEPIASQSSMHPGSAPHSGHRAAHLQHDRLRLVGDHGSLYPVPSATNPAPAQESSHRAYREHPAYSQLHADNTQRGAHNTHMKPQIQDSRRLAYEGYRSRPAVRPEPYDPHYPQTIRELTPDRPLRSVETDAMYRSQQPPTVPISQGPRLITDRNGQSVVIEPPATSTLGATASYHPPLDQPTRGAWPLSLHYGDVMSEAKRRKLSPLSGSHATARPAALVDPAQEVPPHRTMYAGGGSDHARPRIPFPGEQHDASKPYRYQLVPISNQATDRTPQMPIWLDGTFGHSHAEPAPSRRHVPAPMPKERLELHGGYDQHGNGSFMREQPRLVPVDRGERREPQRPPPQVRDHPDDAMRSLYDEREPQQPRKAHRKHHVSRPRYHDHDSSALRQQDQALDYT